MKKIFILFFIIQTQVAFAQNAHLPVEKVWAERISSTQYLIKSADKTKWKIYEGELPRQMRWNSKARILKDSLIVEATPLQRKYFAAVYKKDTIIFSERRFFMEQSPNFRDLGGLKTADGKTVAWGRIFRCGDMGKLSDNDLQMIAQQNIKHVVDFRNEQEVAQSPDKYPANYEIKRVWTSISPSNDEGMKQLYVVMSNPNAMADDVERVFEGFYQQMPNNIKNYAPFFNTLLEANENESVLFHCTAGKDRTGLGAALILSVLGVPEETIIQEYYLSNRYTKYLANTGMLSQIKPAIANVLAGVQRKYIIASLNVIKAKYGSVINMLEQEIGLDQSKRQLLIKKYTF
ncbi:tyrosine-protein phosphatase [Thermoflexibacter ruber]|uniref:Protein-tyrosine phosphatase n=1 Tax=Thermoflexibacter ruber TaxID=1003 RepID=A0A1I2B4Q3_9BACT|nr:tyrosine-protein phosphatase [Thermoflexibacter ruber]SFE50878.1 protein-tyrosine phosphatase [Thermoflexibacter ruber]